MIVFLSKKNSWYLLWTYLWTGKYTSHVPPHLILIHYHCYPCFTDEETEGLKMLLKFTLVSSLWVPRHVLEFCDSCFLLNNCVFLLHIRVSRLSLFNWGRGSIPGHYCHVSVILTVQTTLNAVSPNLIGHIPIKILLSDQCYWMLNATRTESVSTSFLLSPSLEEHWATLSQL